MTKDGRVFKLLQSSASAIHTSAAVFSPPPKDSSTPSINASQQCIWCDNFGHYYLVCQEFHEAIHQDDIYISKTNRILSTRSGKQLPLAIGAGGMKAYLRASV